MGFREPVRRSTLADANESRDWRIYADFAARLIIQARALYASENLGLELSNTVYALDSTTIDLCLSVFPWAHFRTTKAAVKMHTLLDLRGSIPSFIHVSDGKLHDVHALDLLTRKLARSTSWIGVMSTSLACIVLHLAGASSSRAKSNLKGASGVLGPNGSRYRHPLRSDDCARRFLLKQDYPTYLRRVRFKDPETGKTLVFLTNQMSLPAATICALYKSRWQVELFFKWIKQHLRIKQFFGTSENAVKTQIWIAVSVYVLVAIVRKKLNIDASLYTLLQVLSLTLFEKMPLQQAFPGDDYTSDNGISNQLNLFVI